MTISRTHLARWLVPVAVLALMLAGAGLRVTLANATPALPRLTAAQLLVKASQADVQRLSGTVRTSVDLGLPALPGSDGTLAPQELLSGDHTLRVYLDGPDRQRVDLMGRLSETKVVHNGRDVWYWSSATNKATHTVLPAGHRPGPRMDPRMGKPEKAPAGTPQEFAQRLLDMVTPSTQISVGTAATVAGRSAYDLRIAPKTADSLIQRADVYVDSATGLLLRATVLARGAGKPAIDIGFTSLTLRAPSAGVFTFSAPAGAKVTERKLPMPGRVGKPPPGNGWLRGPGPGPQGSMRPRPDGMRPHHVRPGNGLPSLGELQPKLLGSGWATVFEIRVGPALAAAGPQLSIVLKGTRSVSGAFGAGRLITTRLLTVLVTDDGRIFAGPVTSAALLRLANAAGHR